MITANQVKELRDKTGVGLMDCKKALTKTNGNIDEAVKFLREQGILVATKKSGNIAADGLVSIVVNGNNAIIAEINCQTDFVAKGEDFQALTIEATQIAQKNHCNIEISLKTKTKSGETLEESIITLVSKIGENIKFRRCDSVSINNGIIAHYTHNAVANGLGKIGVILGIESTFADKSVLTEFGKKICMHIAASSPVSLDTTGVSSELIQREKDIFTKQAKESGKPDNVIEKMIEGRIKKFFAEVVLLEQPFVMDPKQTVKDVIAVFAKQHSTTLSLVKFVLYKLGDGIEKKEENFAEEVRKAGGE